MTNRWEKTTAKQERVKGRRRKKVLVKSNKKRDSREKRRGISCRPRKTP